MILGFPREIAVLLGAILVVTGPTVIGPMLRYIRPTGRVGPIAQWEGIVIDPIGATLAILVYEAYRTPSAASLPRTAIEVVLGLLLTLLAGLVCGTASARLLLIALRRFWIPDRLQSSVLVATVAVTFTAANLLRPEAGLLAVTIMGLVLANQKRVAIGHIAEFKENLSVLLISSLFILLSARLSVSDLTELGLRGILFVLCLILIVRPLAVWISTIRSGLTWQERMFLGWLAPRGIVAASVASVFALRMGDAGEDLVPATFVVIVGTVLVYGLTAFPLARKLGLAVLNPQGLLVASAHPGARAIAHAVQGAGLRVVLLDSARGNVNAARMEGLAAVQIDLLDEDLVDELDLGGLGRFLALTSNDEVNALATMRFREVFGSSEVYQLIPASESGAQPDAGSLRVHGRLLFGPGATYDDLDDRFESGAVVKRTKLSAEFDYERFVAHYGEQALPLFLIDANDHLTVCTVRMPLKPLPDQTLISLVPPVDATVDNA